MTTIFRNGRFWLADASTLRLIETFPSFPTFAAAKAAAGSQWVEYDPGF